MIHRIVQTGLLVPYGLIRLDFDPLLSPLLTFHLRRLKKYSDFGGGRKK
jgi:hypothetical protein